MPLVVNAKYAALDCAALEIVMLRLLAFAVGEAEAVVAAGVVAAATLVFSFFEAALSDVRRLCVKEILLELISRSPWRFYAQIAKFTFNTRSARRHTLPRPDQSKSGCR